MAFTMGEWSLVGGEAIRVGIKYNSHNNFCILGARIKGPETIFWEDKHLLLENPGVSAYAGGGYVHWITVRNPWKTSVTFNLAVQRYIL
jgi:hypothetical protein